VSTNAPPEHIAESLKLEADTTVDLFEIRLKKTPTIVRFWNGPTRTWRGATYEGIACQLQGDGARSDGQVARPVLSAINPENIFGVFAAEGYFDLAQVTLKRVLQQHFIDNVNLYEQRYWFVGRVTGVTNQRIHLELRSSTDIPNAKSPARTFSPPEFPFVVY